MAAVFFIPKRLRSWISHSDHLAILGLLGLLFAFYPELFLVEAAPLTGDHLEQHYPWAFQLARSLKEFKLPFWTPLIHCGFPLVAESQIGAFYLPNLLMYFFLPFHVAYSYMNLVHWFIAGWGTYLYAKQMKLGAMAAFVAAIIFTFGSAYGGAYYNMTSLKTICWFPVALYLLERYLGKGKWPFLAGLAIVIGQSIVAGYLQMAAFMGLIFALYVVVRIFIFPEQTLSWRKKGLAFFAMFLSAVGALFLAFPQLYLTFRLAMESNRTGLEEGYAYVGSMSPLILGTLFNPMLSQIATGSNLYAGCFTLFLVLFACLSPDARKTSFFKIWFVLAIVALLLALGQWSPLYVALVKITKFYAFRVPAKFLGFFCFGFAMLGAAGFQLLWEGRSMQQLVRRTFGTLLSLLVVYGAGVAFFNIFLTSGRNIALKFGEAYVKNFVYGQPGHPHSLEEYFAMVKTYPDHILKFLSWNNSANIIAVVVAILCLLLVRLFLKKKTVPRFLLGIGIFFLALDLYAASYLDIKMDLAAYQTILTPSPTVGFLKQEKTLGRLGRIYGFRAPGQRLPLTPSQNMLYDVEDIGVYSPLLESRYYQTIGYFGNVNDSNLALTPTPAFVSQRLPILSFLNVSHILSTTKLIHPDLKLVLSDAVYRTYLYKNSAKHKTAYFVTNIKIVEDWPTLKTEFFKEGFDPRTTVLLEKQKVGSIVAALKKMVASDSSWTLHEEENSPDQIRWRLQCSSAGFFVAPELYYPGWIATVNGEPTPIFLADGMFRAIRINGPGNYQIRMRYYPFGRFRFGKGSL